AVGMLVANRLLPVDLPGKGQWEQIAFWSVWALAFLHAAWRSSPVAKARHNPAWREQSLLLGLLSLSAVGLNWITTGDHLMKTVFTDTYWAVAGVDLSLIATALIAFFAAARLRAPVSEQKEDNALSRNKQVNAYD
ncbi:MAG: PepSY domain-containing protein, partial [Pseudomonadota bacterium]|nr:PepSY domain-containing protein [Pseudomonadota bacterium]